MEKEYNFATCSTMKPTQVECAKGSLNQLPASNDLFSCFLVGNP
jgi:hypothetical protein